MKRAPWQSADTLSISEQDALKKNGRRFFAIGVMLSLLGMAAIRTSIYAPPHPHVATRSDWPVYGVLLLSASSTQIIGLFRTLPWRKYSVHGLLGALYGIFGALLLAIRPDQTEQDYPTSTSFFFLGIGILQCAASTAVPFRNWVFPGLISFLLAAGSWAAPTSISPALQFAVEMIAQGWVWILLALALKSPKVERSSAYNQKSSKKSWHWLLSLNITLIVLGMLASIALAVAGGAAGSVFEKFHKGDMGWWQVEDIFTFRVIALPFYGHLLLVGSLALLLLGSSAQIVSAFWARCWSGCFAQLLVGIWYTVTVFMSIIYLHKEAHHNFEFTTLFITLATIGSFLVAGVFRISVSLVIQFHNWGLVLGHGILSIFLGFVITALIRNGEARGPWVIGMCVGVDMLLQGWSQFMVNAASEVSPN